MNSTVETQQCPQANTLRRPSLRKPLSKTENKSEVPEFETTRLGQTPAIAVKLRKLNRNRLIRFQERVDAFTGYYPTRIKDAPDSIACMRAKGKSPGKGSFVPMIGTSKLHDLLAEYHAERDADRRAGLKYAEVCERLALKARGATSVSDDGKGHTAPGK